MLSAVTYEVGQLATETFCRAQISGGASAAGWFIQPHLRFFSRPFCLQTSHLHAAWLANWKWNATISFFVLLQSARTGL